jgi:Cu-processing system ATP-binding protein
MITVTQIEKSYDSLRVLRGLDISLEKGSVTALLGANGAGKSTLIKSMLGLVHPDAGKILFDDRDLSQEIRHDIGYMPQNPNFPENMTVEEIINLITTIRGNKNGIDMSLFHALQLKEERKKKFKHLSGGNKQKINAALAFMFNPKYLFLDEPTNGLDPLSNQAMKQQIVKAKQKDVTVLITSHVLSEIQEIADRIVYLKNGAIWIDRSLKELLDETGSGTLEEAIAKTLKSETQEVAV